MAVNLWKAAFSTIDTSRDLMLTNNEIAETILHFNPEMKVSICFLLFKVHER